MPNLGSSFQRTLANTFCLDNINFPTGLGGCVPVGFPWYGAYWEPLCNDACKAQAQAKKNHPSPKKKK